MFKTVSQILAVVRAAIGANNALQHMNYAHSSDMDELKSAFLADLNENIDAAETAASTKMNATFVSA